MVRLARIEHEGKQKLVAQLKDTNNSDYCYYDLSSIVSSNNIVDYFMLDEEKKEQIRNKLNQDTTTITIPSDECRLLSPIDGSVVGKLLCIGMNYVDHCTEQNFPIPQEPMVFSKFGSCIIGPDDPIVCDKGLTEKLDYEVELAVIIGKTVPRRFSNQEVVNVEDCIGGYTVIHDVSARDWQMERNGGQWLLGKCGDGFAPLGPVVVTPDAFDPANAGIRCRVNDQTLQDSNTSNLIHKVSDIITFLSKFMTLYPGDVIATGTPPGVGCFRKPEPLWLQPGDVVECEIDGIGTLTNPVIEPQQLQSSSRKTVLTKTAAAATTTTTGRLQGMTCIVTGGARGIGYGIAARLGSEGAASVAIVDLHQDAIDDACQNLNTSTDSCRYEGYVCDMGNNDAVQTTFAKIASNNNKIDVLVQAAGIVGETNIVTEDVNPSNFEDVFRVNVMGTFHGCKAVLPYMKQNNYGRIINIASISGKEGNAGMVSYSSSKAAVIGMTKSIGKEYASAEGSITCNAVAPAVVRTAMVEAMPSEQVKYMTDKIPMKRCGTVEEIASLVVYIASPESGFTTGFCFDATGGRTVY